MMAIYLPNPYLKFKNKERPKVLPMFSFYKKIKDKCFLFFGKIDLFQTKSLKEQNRSLANLILSKKQALKKESKKLLSKKSAK